MTPGLKKQLDRKLELFFDRSIEITGMYVKDNIEISYPEIEDLIDFIIDADFIDEVMARSKKEGAPVYEIGGIELQQDISPDYVVLDGHSYPADTVESVLKALIETRRYCKVHVQNGGKL